MAGPQFSALFLRLARDPELRKKFADNPHEVLRAEGINPDRLNLPARIDLEVLEKKVEQAFSDQPGSWTAAPDEVAKLSADELWERFGVIAERPDRSEASQVAVVANASTTTVAVVAYGTSVVTSEGAMVALEKAQLLRSIAKLKKSDLTFAVKGPDGVAVEDLPAATVEALLRRLN